MRLSVVIVAKNEAADITACLASIAWAEERLVVDTGSQDDTREVARCAGARVLEHPWEGYSATKNWAFAQAQGEWILSLDADEWVSESLAQEIPRRVEAESSVIAFEMPRRFHFLGRWLRHGGCYPDWQLRLFRRGQARYGEEKVHERLQVVGKIGRLQGHLEHYSYPSLSEYLAKLDEYSSLWAEQAYARGKRKRWYHSFSLLTGFTGRYLFKGGFLDGGPGFTWAVLAGMHSYCKYAKLNEWERRSE